MMLKTALAGAFLALVASSVAYGGWQKYQCAKGEISVDFPVVPEVSTRFVQGDSFRMEQRSYSCEDGRTGYNLTSVLMPANVRAGRAPDDILKSAAQAAKPKDWKTYDEVWLGVDDIRTLRFTLRPSENYEAHHYYMLTGTRLYCLVVVALASPNAKADADRFFNSFRPLEADEG